VGATVIGRKSFFISSGGVGIASGIRQLVWDRYASGSAGTGGEADDGYSV
jgi:hypothetical protein